MGLQCYMRFKGRHARFDRYRFRCMENELDELWDLVEFLRAELKQHPGPELERLFASKEMRLAKVLYELREIFDKYKVVT